MAQQNNTGKKQNHGKTQPSMENAMQHALKDYKNRFNKFDNYDLNLKPLHLLKDDGEDHINIWSPAQTDLGKLLSFDCYSASFRHKLFDKFSSINCFWVWITSEIRDDRVRFMNAVNLKNFGKTLNKTRVKNFKAIMMDTVYQRIKAYPVIESLMIESELPFDVYYINNTNGNKIRPNFFPWLLAGTEEIRNALKENREPDFTFLLDDQKSSIYEFVAPLETTILSKNERKKLNDKRKAEQKRLADLVRPSVSKEHTDEQKETGQVPQEQSSESPIVEEEQMSPIDESVVDTKVETSSPEVEQENTSEEVSNELEETK